MFLFGRKDETISEEGLNVRSFINDTYCTITKAASLERTHDNFIIDHSWEILNVSLLTFFDNNNTSQCKIKKKTINSFVKNEESNFNSNCDEILLSTSAKAFAILSHASNVVVQSLTNKKYFYHLSTLFLNKQIKKKSGNIHEQITKSDIGSTSDSEKQNNLNNESFPISTSINDFSESASTQTSTSMHDCEVFDDDLDDESSWLLSSEIIISRIAVIFQNIINEDSDHIKDSAQLLILFLPFADNSGVFDLLSTSFSNNLMKPNLFHHLSKFEIVDEILKIISSFKIGKTRINEATAITDECNKNIEDLELNNSGSESSCSILISNNLSILSIISRNKYLIQNINANNQLFSILSQFASLNSLDISIKNNMWRVISAICNEQTIKSQNVFLKFLFSKAMRIISDPYTTLNMYHTFVMDFLAKIMKYQPNFFIENDMVMLKSIIEVISRLIAQFPDSTNLQSSIARFIIASVDHQNISSPFSRIFSFSNSNAKSDISNITKSVVKDLLPLIIVTAQSKHVRTSAAANCVSVIYRISLMSSSNSIISQFCSTSPLYKNFMSNFMNDYMNKLGSSYGGPVNEENSSLKSLSKFTNEIKMNQNHAIFV